MSLAPYVHAMGRGPGRARSLDRSEAEDAMRLILSGEAAPEAIGALFMLMRYRGETAGEIAGFVTAMRAGLDSWTDTGATLDWPSYAAGRSRGLPLFLLSARLVAQAGARVLLHGWNSHQNPLADVRGALDQAGIAQAETPEAAKLAMDRDGVVYVPLEAMDARLLSLLRLREVLGLRSPVNTALRALNPARAPATVQGVFHPPYRELQQDTGAELGEPQLLVLKGGGGEFERNPAKPVLLYGLQDGRSYEQTIDPLLDENRRLADPTASPGDLARIWSGRLDDEFARATILGTGALALVAAGIAPDIAAAETRAAALWSDRQGAAAA
ncbi:MAG: glycosyl transferase family protein [Pseudomonadota bacterium]